MRKWNPSPGATLFVLGGTALLAYLWAKDSGKKPRRKSTGTKGGTTGTKGGMTGTKGGTTGTKGGTTGTKGGTTGTKGGSKLPTPTPEPQPQPQPQPTPYTGTVPLVAYVVGDRIQIAVDDAWGYYDPQDNSVWIAVPSLPVELPITVDEQDANLYGLRWSTYRKMSGYTDLLYASPDGRERIFRATGTTDPQNQTFNLELTFSATVGATPITDTFMVYVQEK